MEFESFEREAPGEDVVIALQRDGAVIVRNQVGPEIAEWVGASVEVIEKTYRHVLPLDHADLSFTRVDRTKTEPDRTKSTRSGGIHRRK